MDVSDVSGIVRETGVITEIKPEEGESLRDTISRQLSDKELMYCISAYAHDVLKYIGQEQHENLIVFQDKLYEIDIDDDAVKMPEHYKADRKDNDTIHIDVQYHNGGMCLGEASVCDTRTDKIIMHDRIYEHADVIGIA